MKSLCLVFLFLLLSLGATAQRTAILGALDQEIAILLDSLKDKKEEQYGGLTFYTGNLKGQAVVIAKSGVGKVNAAWKLTKYLCDNPDIENVVNYGSAGGINPDFRGLLKCTKFLQGDIDCRPLGVPLGHTPYEEIQQFENLLVILFQSYHEQHVALQSL